MAEVGNFSASSRKGGRVVIHVAGRERHAEDHVDAGQGAERLEGLELPPPAALDAADAVVGGLVAVGRDGDDELLGAPAGARGDRFGGGDHLVGQVAVGREVEEEEVGAAVDHRVADVDEVLAQRDLAAREIDPQEAARAREEAADLVERELVARRHLPDVAGRAAVVAPEGDAEGELEGEVEAPEVRPESGLGEGGVGRETHAKPAYEKTSSSASTKFRRGAASAACCAYQS